MMKERINRRPRKPQIGDLVEIDTSVGLAYVQYTHDGTTQGEVVRVLPGLYETRPTDLAALARQRELYFIFYLMQHPIRQGLATVISNESVPPWAVHPPMMRLPVTRDYDLGRVLKWRIVSASNRLTLPELVLAPVVSELTPEQEKLSIRVIRPHAAMIRELARGWTPERAAQLGALDATRRNEEKKLKGVSDRDEIMHHYLYFPSSSHAGGAANHLCTLGFKTKVELAPDGEKWLVLASKLHSSTGDEMAELRDELEGVAVRFSGNYDGWEVALVQATSSGSVS